MTALYTLSPLPATCPFQIKWRMACLFADHLLLPNLGRLKALTQPSTIQYDSYLYTFYVFQRFLLL